MKKITGSAQASFPAVAPETPVQRTLDENTLNTFALLSHILDAFDDICYVADPETYDLLYINQAGRQAVAPGEGEVSGKCYKILQQSDKPCDFCTNHLLSVGKKITWERYNHFLKKYYVLTDTMIRVDGKTLRLELARNITEFRNRQQSLMHKLTLEENLVACVECLASDVSISDSLNKLLSIVGEYYQASRAYIFEIHHAENYLENTYEWCRAGVSPQLHNLTNIPLSAVDTWLARFREHGVFTIPSLAELAPDSLEYQILEPQGIESLMAAPLMTKDSIIGFLGVDNPTANCNELRLLRAVPFFVQDELVKRRMMDKLEWLSFRDVLTGLYNRNKYAAALGEIMECPPEKMGIIYVDVNGLKTANDTYGHEYGDQVILKVVEHIKAALAGDIYRIGGDEFVALYPGVDEAALDAMVSGLRERMAHEEDISISIGSSWNEGRIDPGELIRFADDRMYADKQNYYRTQLTAQASRKADAVSRLHSEIEMGNFKVLLQPQVHLRSGDLVGAEAIVRKQSHCSLPAGLDNSAPFYELEGIVRHLDFHVLETVCSALREWTTLGLTMPVTVSFSRMTLLENNIVNAIEEMIRSHGVEPSRIRIKIPENANRMDIRLLKVLIAEFQRKGFTAALGGFGSEISNVAILAAVEFNEVAFHRDFIRDIDSNPRNLAILENGLALCRDLGSATVAEGIDSLERFDFLKNKLCDCGQGDFFSPPLEFTDFYNFFKNRPAGFYAVPAQAPQLSDPDRASKS